MNAPRHGSIVSLALGVLLRVERLFRNAYLATAGASRDFR